MKRYVFSLFFLVALILGLSLGARSAWAEGQSKGDEVSAETLIFCDGGAVEATLSNIQDAPSTRGEGAAFVALAGSSVPCTATGDSDTCIVTFSAECQLANSSANDWVEIEVRLDGVAMEPAGSAANPLAFCSGTDFESQSATFCKRVPVGSHTVQVFWRLVDNSPFAVLTGWLDDWTVSVVRSN